MCQEQLNRRWGESYFNQCIICRAQSNFFGRIQTPAVCDRPFLFLRVCVCQEHLRSRSGNAYLNTCMIRRTRSIFVLSHTDCFLFWPIFMDLAWECVTGRWRGFRRCIFEYMSQSIFFGPHTDSCLFWPTIFFLACACVTGSWTGVQAMPFCIHV